MAGEAAQGVDLVDEGEELSSPASGDAIGPVRTGTVRGREPRLGVSLVGRVLTPVSGRFPAPLRVRNDNAVVAVPVDARRRNQMCKPVKQSEGTDEDQSASVVYRRYVLQ